MNTQDTTGLTPSSFRPDVDIIETADAIVLYADMPGAEPENLSVNFERGLLSVSAKINARTDSPGNQACNHLLREYGVGNYERSFKVNENIDSTRIEAEYTDGVLVLRLPKAEAAKPRKIQIKTC